MNTAEFLREARGALTERLTAKRIADRIRELGIEVEVGNPRAYDDPGSDGQLLDVPFVLRTPQGSYKGDATLHRIGTVKWALAAELKDWIEGVVLHRLRKAFEPEDFKAALAWLAVNIEDRANNTRNRLEIPTSKPQSVKKVKVPKKPTFQAARTAVLAYLKTLQWKLSPLTLKVTHATSPDGTLRLWFKRQAVWFTQTDGRVKHDFKDARSTWTDIRELSPEKYVAEILRYYLRT